MSGPNKKISAFVLLVLALALAVMTPGALRIDLGFAGKGGHALFQIGFASIELAFDFGQECPNSNSCGGALL